MILRTLLAASFFIIYIPAETLAQEEPPYGMGELEAYSVFVDAYRNDDFEQAITFGEWMLEVRPREMSGHPGFSLETQFNRMINVYVGAAEGESDPTQQTNYLEKAEQVFHNTFEIFDEEEIDLFAWKVRMGRFYHENHENMSASMNEAYAIYEELYGMDSQRFAEEGDGFFARILLLNYASNGDREAALEMIDEVETFASAELRETIGDVRESLFENPEERIDFIVSRIDDADTDEREEMLQSLIELYEETGQAEKATETALELYELNPDYMNTRKIANIHLSEGNYREAIDFLLEAKELAEPEDERLITLEIAESYQQIQQLEEARDYAREAIRTDESWGAAYMRMASIYAAAVSQCSGGEALEREDRTVYWLVIDYLERAIQADSSLQSSAGNRIRSYEEAMPTSEHKFFNDWEDGESFTIDGNLKECYDWINETTTVR